MGQNYTQELIRNGIKFITSADVVESFVKGWSGDKTFCIRRDNQKFFLKVIYNHLCDFNNFEVYKSLNIKIPKVIEYGNLSDQNAKYYITEFIEGKDLGDAFKSLSDDFIFQTATLLGTEQISLSQLYKPKKASNDDKTKLFTRYDKEMNKFFPLIDKNKTEINPKFLNYEIYTKLLKIVHKTKESFNDENVYFCHDDCMPNNFMIDKENNLWTIDVEGTRYDFFAKKIAWIYSAHVPQARCP